MTGGEGPKKIVIVRKKKVGHAAHHGGSWKVAYADFVTAMMAFFLVMWILGMDQGVRDLVQGYFNNPVGFRRNFSGGSNVVSAGNHPSNLDLPRNPGLGRDAERQRFREAGESIRERLMNSGLGRFDADVEIVVTDAGLRIEMMETGDEETFFDKSSAQLKPLLRSILEIVAQELSALSNDVVVEGHTDSLQFGTPAYTNWELSGDRANAARRVLETSGLGEYRVVEVRGYADRQPKIPASPADPRNRRISVLLPFEEEIRLEFLPTPVVGMEGSSLGTGDLHQRGGIP
jgi:chemotaxis protein MotB